MWKSRAIYEKKRKKIKKRPNAYSTLLVWLKGVMTEKAPFNSSTMMWRDLNSRFSKRKKRKRLVIYRVFKEWVKVGNCFKMFRSGGEKYEHCILQSYFITSNGTCIFHDKSGVFIIFYQNVLTKDEVLCCWSTGFSLFFHYYHLQESLSLSNGIVLFFFFRIFNQYFISYFLYFILFSILCLHLFRFSSLLHVAKFWCLFCLFLILLVRL